MKDLNIKQYKISIYNNNFINMVLLMYQSNYISVIAVKTTQKTSKS